MNQPEVIAPLIATHYFGGPENRLSLAPTGCARSLSPLIIAFAPDGGRNNRLERARPVCPPARIFQDVQCHSRREGCHRGRDTRHRQ